MKRKNKQGFSLIEMLIVTLILSVVSLAMYATFNNGIKIWQRINKPKPAEDVDIFFNKFVSDLRNTFKFSGLAFRGEGQQLEFATLVNSPRLNKRTVGRAAYFYNPATGILNRQYQDFSGVYNDEAVPFEALLKNITSLKFQYYFYDNEKKEYIWQEKWSAKDLPLAVRIELEINDDAQPKKFTRTVNIALSG